MPSSRTTATRTLPPGGARAAPMPRSDRIRASTPPLICSTGISWHGCGARVTSCSPVRKCPTGDSSSNPGDPIHYEFNLVNRLIRLSVRRACFGPGLWPGPCRQARWAGRGLRRSRAGPAGRFLRSGQKRPSGALDAGGASPDNARRSGPLTATSSRHPAHLARARRPGRGAGGRGSGIRRGPQAAGRPGAAVRGSSPRRRARVRRTRRKLPPRNGETPGEPRPPTAGHPGRSSPRDCSRPSSLFTAGAVRPGAPKVRP